MFCENCGANIEVGSSFCAKCGARVEYQPDMDFTAERKTSHKKRKVKVVLIALGALALIFVMWAIAETLSKIVTMNAIMNLVYVLLGISIVYILKNA